MVDETISTKQQWYDLNKYKDEIRSFVVKRRTKLDCAAKMESSYNKLYRTVFAGTEESDTERFPHTAEMFKVYKAALIEACLSGYSALLESNGEDAYSMLKIPELKATMIRQFKSMALLENISDRNLDDWCLKGEAAGFIRLVEDKEEYRIKETLTDAETGKPVIKFTLKEGVTTRRLQFDYIDPLDLYVDAIDYKKDPIGCTKIIRSWIDAKTLLCSDAYPLLSTEEKNDIVNATGKDRGVTWLPFSLGSKDGNDYNRTDKDKIEVLTFYGDYITSDYKVLNNIKATIVDNKIAKVEYNPVNSLRIIYAPYKVDRRTHRGISPLICADPINKLINRVTDMFLQNMEDVANPIMLYQKGSITAQQSKEVRTKRECEYIGIGDKPEFWSPPPASTNGLQFLETILQQNKNVLGLNSYMAGDTSGAVRTARESAILTQKANARMRVETDVFSYNFLLPLFTAFYTFNRELAIAAGEPLAPIYADEKLKVSISTNASRADKEGEFNRLMEMLQLPISQMIFSNLSPEQVVMAVRYLMAKAELKDVDNLLELIDSEGNPQYPVNPEEAQAQAALPPPSEMPPQGMDIPQEPPVYNGPVADLPEDIPIDDLLQQ